MFNIFAVLTLDLYSVTPFHCKTTPCTAYYRLFMKCKNFLFNKQNGGPSSLTNRKMPHLVTDLALYASNCVVHIQKRSLSANSKFPKNILTVFQKWPPSWSHTLGGGSAAGQNDCTTTGNIRAKWRDFCK
jgi:hypothetical protein